jgi:hypothetical protein
LLFVENVEVLSLLSFCSFEVQTEYEQVINGTPKLVAVPNKVKEKELKI